MDEQQQLIKDTLDRLLTDLCTSEVVAKSEEGEFASEVWQSLAENGIDNGEHCERVRGFWWWRQRFPFCYP